jgi:hypothetical protein
MLTYIQRVESNHEPEGCSSRSFEERWWVGNVRRSVHANRRGLSAPGGHTEPAPLTDIRSIPLYSLAAGVHSAKSGCYRMERYNDIQSLRRKIVRSMPHSTATHPLIRISDATDSLDYGNESIRFEVVFTRRKTLQISVHANERVVVRAPLGTSAEKIAEWVQGGLGCQTPAVFSPDAATDRAASVFQRRDAPVFGTSLPLARLSG